MFVINAYINALYKLMQMFAQTTPNNINNNHSAPAEKLLSFIHDTLQSSLHNKWLILILHQPIKGEMKLNLLL